ncbi:MAG: hypothetical protein J6D57_07795 [Mogibacterium sp.]|nr:hypothetical protein [Mogibacterium sp.]
MSNMWHVALEPGKTRLQDVILADISADDFDTICCLLSTDRLKGKILETERGSYLFMYGGEYERPYPSVMIWRASVVEGKIIFGDMRQEDGWIVETVWHEWLMPEGTDAEYVPPERFLLMHKK